jgi:hypothetical protein
MVGAHHRARLENSNTVVVVNRCHKEEGCRLATMERKWKAQIHGHVAVKVNPFLIPSHPYHLHGNQLHYQLQQIMQLKNDLLALAVLAVEILIQNDA